MLQLAKRSAMARRIKAGMGIAEAETAAGRIVQPVAQTDPSENDLHAGASEPAPEALPPPLGRQGRAVGNSHSPPRVDGQSLCDRPS